MCSALFQPPRLTRAFARCFLSRLLIKVFSKNAHLGDLKRLYRWCLYLTGLGSSVPSFHITGLWWGRLLLIRAWLRLLSSAVMALLLSEEQRCLLLSAVADSMLRSVQEPSRQWWARTLTDVEPTSRKSRHLFRHTAQWRSVIPTQRVINYKRLRSCHSARARFLTPYNCLLHSAVREEVASGELPW